jgi:hypothetical protein
MTAITIPEAEIETGALPALREEPALPVRPSPRNPIELLALALERGTPLAEMRELLALQQTMEQRQAFQNFAAAMAAFQAECPPIRKSSTAKFATRGGGEMGYTFAALDEIARTVNPILARHGLSYTWDATVTSGALTCVCTVRHCDGHATTATITLPTDSASAMSSQQKVGSALTFARRLSLVSALGLTTTDDDTDGRDEPAAFIKGEQADELYALVERAGVDPDKFLRWASAESFAKVPANRYADAVANLNGKIAKREATA